MVPDLGPAYYHRGMLGRLNEMKPVKSLAECLAQSQSSMNVSCSYSVSRIIRVLPDCETCVTLSVNWFGSRGGKMSWILKPLLFSSTPGKAD